MAKKSKFSDQLVLNQYMLGLFGVNTFANLTNELKSELLEDLTENNISKFHQQLVTYLPSSSSLTQEMLRRYDENIIRYTFEISEKREKSIKWKYFQYLSLLFTEIYLDKYFNTRAELLADLNEILSNINQTLSKKEQINPFVETDLKKLAFWNATGSGKTLIMHVNIKQYLNYFRQNNEGNHLDNIILLTPSEGLSKQHESEFVLSNISAKLFDKNEGACLDNRKYP